MKSNSGRRKRSSGPKRRPSGARRGGGRATSGEKKSRSGGAGGSRGSKSAPSERADPSPGKNGPEGARLDFQFLVPLIVGVMALLWAIASPGREGTLYKSEIRWVMFFLSLASFIVFFHRLRTYVPSSAEVEADSLVSLEFLTDEELEYVQRDWTLSRRLIYTFSISGALQRYFPYIGVGVIFFDLAYNISQGEYQIKTFDTIILIFGGLILTYNYVPERFSGERDFALLFFAFMCLLLVYLIFFIVGPLDESSRGGFESVRDDPNVVIQYLLAEPVAAFLRVFGYDVTAQGEIIEYENRYDDSGPQSVWIGAACTGIYSISIFLSMYLAYLMSEFKRFTRTMLALVVLGILMAYLANILRMSIIILAGVHYGPSTLYWVHKEVGWMIFMTWVFLFWAGSNRLISARGTA